LFIGITIDKYKGINPSVLIRLIRKIGLNFIEITKSIFDDLPDALNELGKIKTGFHLPNYGDHGFDFSCEEQQEKIDRLISQINQHYHDLHIHYCLSHPPECPPKSNVSRNKSNSILFDNLKKLKPPIVLENVAGLSQAQFETFFLKAKAAIGSKVMGQCYDAPHYFTRGDDPVSILNNLDGDINSVIKTIHLSDCTREKDAHLPFGLGGSLPVDDVLESLKKQNYSGIINLELLPRSLADLQAVVDSYLKVLKMFDKLKYMRTRLKLSIYMPILKRIIPS